MTDKAINDTFQRIQTKTILANDSYTTDIYANTGIPLDNNTGLYKLQRQKAYLIILSTLTDLGDNTGYIFGVLRIGRNGGNVTFTKVSENGVTSAIQRLNLVTFSAGTSENDTVIVNNGSNISIMINIIV